MRVDNSTNDIYVVDKPQDIRLIFSEKHNMILRLLMEQDLSISDIAKILSINPGSVHYHLKELEKHGLVKQVREEVKRGIIKKYYRSAAKRILIDSPNFGAKNYLDHTTKEYIDRLIASIEFLGYQLPPENLDDAKDLLSRYDHRIKELLSQLHDTGLENVENDGVILQNAYNLIFNIWAREDPEMGRIYSEFAKLFLRYE